MSAVRLKAAYHRKGERSGKAQAGDVEGGKLGNLFGRAEVFQRGRGVALNGDEQNRPLRGGVRDVVGARFDHHCDQQHTDGPAGDGSQAGPRHAAQRAG